MSAGLSYDIGIKLTGADAEARRYQAQLEAAGIKVKPGLDIDQSDIDKAIGKMARAMRNAMVRDVAGQQIAHAIGTDRNDFMETDRRVRADVIQRQHEDRVERHAERQRIAEETDRQFDEANLRGFHAQKAADEARATADSSGVPNGQAHGGNDRLAMIAGRALGVAGVAVAVNQIAGAAVAFQRAAVSGAAGARQLDFAGADPRMIAGFGQDIAGRARQAAALDTLGPIGKFVDAIGGFTAAADRAAFQMNLIATVSATNVKKTHEYAQRISSAKGDPLSALADQQMAEGEQADLELRNAEAAHDEAGNSNPIITGYDAKGYPIYGRPKLDAAAEVLKKARAVRQQLTPAQEAEKSLATEQFNAQILGLGGNARIAAVQQGGVEMKTRGNVVGAFAADKQAEMIQMAVQHEIDRSQKRGAELAGIDKGYEAQKSLFGARTALESRQFVSDLPYGQEMSTFQAFGQGGVGALQEKVMQTTSDQIMKQIGDVGAILQQAIKDAAASIANNKSA